MKNVVDLQKKGHLGAMRVSENHNLLVSDLTFRKDEKEISIEAKDTKTYIDREFLIVGEPFSGLVERYFEMIPKVNTNTGGAAYLYPPWHLKGKKFTRNQRRGQKWMQRFIKQAAKSMVGPDTKRYSHHSLRKSAATAAYEKGASILQCMHLGGWKSEKAMQQYITHSKGTKRKLAKMMTRGMSKTIKNGKTTSKHVQLLTNHHFFNSNIETNNDQ